MKDFTFLTFIHKVEISCSPPFSSEIADLAEKLWLEGPEKTGISLLYRAGATGNNKFPVAGQKKRQ